MKKLISGFIGICTALASFSSLAAFDAWVYDYESNTPAAELQSWEGVNLVNTSAGSANATFSGVLGSEKYCFDGKLNTRWIQQVTNPWVIYKFPAVTKITSYALRQATNNGYDTRVPVSFELYGSNAETAPTTATDESWVVLDARTQVFHNYNRGSYDFGSRVFWLGHAASYRYYLLKVLSNNGDSYTVLGQLEFYNQPFVTDLAFKSGPVISRQDGVYKASGSFLCPNDCEIKAVVSDGENEVEETVGSFTGSTEEQEFVYTLPATLSANKTYSVNFLSVRGEVEVETSTAAFYTGALTLTKTNDASEEGLTPAELTVSRASADPVALPVTVILTEGTAQEGVNYGPMANPVVIPAGATSATFQVTPLLDNATKADTELTVSIGCDNTASEGVSVAVVIANITIPSDKNVWVAGASSDGLASTASNWSKGVPRADSPESLVILVDGSYSNHKLIWDANSSSDLAQTVTSWMQSGGYTGTVEFNTEFPGYAGASFTLFTVTRDCEILSGKWTCRGNYNNYGAATESATAKLAAGHWCLNVAVGGSLTVGVGASIDVTGKGFGHPGTQTSPCYGGYSFGPTQSCAPYGSVTEPFDLGMGARSQGDQNSKRSAIGGGALKLTVSGNVTVDGGILALGNIDLNVPRSGGTGGSIWIDASQISGAGTINASGCPASSYTSDSAVAVGSGGRIALYTQSPLALPRDNLLCGGSSYAVSSVISKTRIGAAGTIFIKDPTLANGVLVLKQEYSQGPIVSANGTTPLIDDMTLDGIELYGRVVLQVGNGKALTLPGGFASVTSSVSTVSINGISYRDGTIDVGTGDQTINGWMLEPVSNFVFAGNLTLERNGGVGIIKRTICGTEDAVCPPRVVSFAVNGDLAIDATSALDVANVVGYTHYSGAMMGGWYGGWTTYYDGYANMTNAQRKTYGSVFNPVDFGSSPIRSYLAGGALDVTVSGTVTLLGKITASGPYSDSTSDGTAPSSAGSIKMTVGSISGTGTIGAVGGAGRRNYAGGAGGGRIAIKLTETGATIPEGMSVNAQGRYGYSFDARCDKIGSAGTVYVETAADGAKGGTITISNWRDRKISEFTSATVIPTTPIVAYNNGDPVEDFKKVGLVVTNNAIAEVSVSQLKMKSVVVAEDSKIDLMGNSYVVKAALLGGVKLQPGTYKASDYPAYLVDSLGTDGTLQVLGSGLKFIIR